MRIIVTGSRSLYPQAEARRILAKLVTESFPEEIRIVHGCCPSNNLRNPEYRPTETPGRQGRHPAGMAHRQDQHARRMKGEEE